MPTKPKNRRGKWPHYARWAALDCGEMFQQSLREARKLQNHPDPEVAAMAGRIADNSNRGIRFLNSVGIEIPEDNI